MHGTNVKIDDNFIAQFHQLHEFPTLQQNSLRDIKICIENINSILLSLWNRFRGEHEYDDH